MVERSTSFGTGMSFQTGAAKFMNDAMIGQRKVETHTVVVEVVSLVTIVAIVPS